MKHYKLTEETLLINLTKLHRIELNIDCKFGNVGDKGGWIENEDNLSGDAWVYGNARVYGDARVSGNARVYGDAWVYGNAEVYGDAWEKSPLQIQGTKHFINECENGFIKIGCKVKPINEWINEFEKIGKENGYTEKEIKEYELYINLIKTLTTLKN